MRPPPLGPVPIIRALSTIPPDRLTPVTLCTVAILTVSVALWGIAILTLFLARRLVL